MEKKTIYLIGGGVALGGAFLYLSSHKKKGAEEAAPLYAASGAAEPSISSGSAPAEIALAEQRGQFEATEGKQNAELAFAHEMVSALENRPSGIEEIKSAESILQQLGLYSGVGASVGNQQLTPASTTSSNTESGSHLPASPPTTIKSVIQALEPVPNTAHEWQLSTVGGTAGKYYYQGTYQGKPVHIYHASNFPGAVGPSHNLVVV